MSWFLHPKVKTCFVSQIARWNRTCKWDSRPSNISSDCQENFAEVLKDVGSCFSLRESSQSLFQARALKVHSPLGKKKTKTFVLTRKPLLKGKAQYGRSPWTNLFRSAAFHSENIIFLCYETSYLKRRLTVLSLSVQLVFLVLTLSKMFPMGDCSFNKHRLMMYLEETAYNRDSSIFDWATFHNAAQI
jgi:hypothetical protein